MNSNVDLNVGWDQELRDLLIIVGLKQSQSWLEFAHKNNIVRKTTRVIKPVSHRVGYNRIMVSLYNGRNQEVWSTVIDM